MSNRVVLCAQCHTPIEPGQPAWLDEAGEEPNAPLHAGCLVEYLIEQDVWPQGTTRPPGPATGSSPVQALDAIQGRPHAGPEEGGEAS